MLPTGHLPPEKLSRRPKAMPHAYFPTARYSLYIDNTVAFKRLPQASDLATAAPQLFKAFQHARHTQLDQEAYAIAMLGYEDAATICRQLAFYGQRLPLAEVSPLTTGTVLLREHHDPTVQRFGTLWWESILAYSKRDQLSLDVARRMAGCGVEYWPGVTRDNAFVRWQGSLAPSRLRASFDPQRYAWQHRDEPEAQRDPKGHALAHGRGADADCQRPARVLELLAYQQRSSLGAQVSPRRGIADALEALCVPFKREGARCVVVRVQGDTAPLAYAADELDAAGRALAVLMGQGVETSLLDLPLADLAQTGRVYTAGSGPAYDLAVVLGPRGADLPALAQKLVRLLAPAAGGLVLACAGEVTLDQALQAERAVAAVVGVPVSTALQPSQHDSQPGLLANALVGLRWGPVGDAVDARPLV